MKEFILYIWDEIVIYFLIAIRKIKEFRKASKKLVLDFLKNRNARNVIYIINLVVMIVTGIIMIITFFRFWSDSYKFWDVVGKMGVFLGVFLIALYARKSIRENAGKKHPFIITIISTLCFFMAIYLATILG